MQSKRCKMQNQHREFHGQNATKYDRNCVIKMWEWKPCGATTCAQWSCSSILRKHMQNQKTNMISSQENIHIIIWRNLQNAKKSTWSPCQIESCNMQKSKFEIKIWKLQWQNPKGEQRMQNATQSRQDKKKKKTTLGNGITLTCINKSTLCPGLSKPYSNYLL